MRKLSKIVFDFQLLPGSLISNLNDAIEYRRLKIFYLFDMLPLQNRVQLPQSPPQQRVEVVFN